MVVYPGVQVNHVEGHALFAHRDLHQVGTHAPIETVLVHAEIECSVPESDKARYDTRELGHCSAGTSYMKTYSSRQIIVRHWLCQT